MGNIFLFFAAASALCAVSSLPARKYHFFYELKTWNEAQSFCREHYSDLATIDNMDDMNILNKMASSQQGKAWIGLYDDVNSWRWSMSDSNFYQQEQKEFRNWNSGEPDNYHSGQHCGSMTNAGLWSDEPCSYTRKLVCFNITGTVVEFVLINTVMTWTAAQKYCREYYSDLASVRNMAENQKIQELIPVGERVWIGLYRDAWKWSDGRNFSLSYWNSNEPNNANYKEHCVSAEFNAEGKWEDWVCDGKKAFICYSIPVSKKVLALKLEKTSQLDLNDHAVLEELLNQLKQKLKEQGLNEDIQLSWRKQSDGNVFHKEKNKQTSV